MKKIKILTLGIITMVLISCSTSQDDQFKYVTPPPTQQNMNSENPVALSNQETISNKSDTSNKQELNNKKPNE
jgi:hypothetical protein